MNYAEYKIFAPDAQSAEIVVAELSELGFDSFTEYDPEQGSVNAYIPQQQNQLLRMDIEAYLRGVGYLFEVKVIPAQDWNSLWESNFEPTMVGSGCHIRAPFHPANDAEFDIVIMPKMSFGTGHHATTHLMVEAILEEDMSGLSGADVGSGTGILSILAARKGAVVVDAIDIDAWAYENCIENIQTNNVQGTVCPVLSDASALQGKLYDFILANINRNILLEDMPKYGASLRKGGFILFSGILDADVADISRSAEQAGLSVEKTRSRNGWSLIKAVK